MYFNKNIHITALKPHLYTNYILSLERKKKYYTKKKNSTKLKTNNEYYDQIEYKNMILTRGMILA